MDELKVASLLVSRLCHDLAAPAGAVNNGLELLRGELPDGSAKSSLELTEFSANETLSRLQFFRLCFGAAGGLGAKLPLSQARIAAEDFFDGRKVGLVWPAEAPDDLAQTAVKLLLNLILLGSEGLPRGGELSVEIGADSFGVAGKGEGAALSVDRREALDGTLAEEVLDARLVQAFYTGALARSAGATLKITGEVGRLSLKASFTIS